MPGGAAATSLPYRQLRQGAFYLISCARQQTIYPAAFCTERIPSPKQGRWIILFHCGPCGVPNRRWRFILRLIPYLTGAQIMLSV